jgi:hypothetical protein
VFVQVCDEGQRERLLSRVRCYYEILKTSTFGKHIVNRLEKLLSAGMRIQINSLPPVLPNQAPAAAPMQQQCQPAAAAPPTQEEACVAPAGSAPAQAAGCGNPPAQQA